MTDLEWIKREKLLRRAFDEYVYDCYIAENNKGMKVFQYCISPYEALYSAYPVFYQKEFEKWVELYGNEVKND